MYFYSHLPHEYWYYHDQRCQQYNHIAILSRFTVPDSPHSTSATEEALDQQCRFNHLLADPELLEAPCRTATNLICRQVSTGPAACWISCPDYPNFIWLRTEPRIHWNRKKKKKKEKWIWPISIELMHDAIGHILQLRDNLKERYHYEALTVPYPTLNLGIFTVATCRTAFALAVSCIWIFVRVRQINELNGLLNDALAPVSERLPVGFLTVDELHPPILGLWMPPNNWLEVAGEMFGAKTEVVNRLYRSAKLLFVLCPTLVLGFA